MECFRLLFDHLAWIKHWFLSGIRDSRKAGILWGMVRGVGGVRKSIHQSWLAIGFGLGFGLLCWGFKGVQQEIPLEEASTLQIGSVAFPLGQCTSWQLHLCHRLFDQDGHQDSCFGRCPWCSRYRRRNWTRRHEFKSWTRLIAFHIALIPLGKVWIQLFSLQLWVNSRTD